MPLIAMPPISRPSVPYVLGVCLGSHFYLQDFRVPPSTVLETISSNNYLTPQALVVVAQKRDDVLTLVQVTRLYNSH